MYGHINGEEDRREKELMEGSGSVTGSTFYGDDSENKLLSDLEDGYSHLRGGGSCKIRKETDSIRKNSLSPSASPAIVPEGKFSSPSLAPSRLQRLLSLDVFRGFTVALMIFVDYIGGIFPSISHSPWDGVNIADFVMPFFLFIVGVSLALALKRLPNKVDASKKVLLRALKLFILGLILQGGFFHGVDDLTFGVDISSMRVMGILQRIAIAYLLVALCEIWFQPRSDPIESGMALLGKYKLQLLAGSVWIILYITFLYGIYVPDWTYEDPQAGINPRTLSVNCDIRGDTGPGCNAVGFIDRKILGSEHLYKRPSYFRLKECSVDSPNIGSLPYDSSPWCQASFDPEGLLSSMMAVITCLIGLQFGHVIIHFKNHKERIINWMMASVFLLVVGFSLEMFGIHMNKDLYSLSYTCVTAGIAGTVFIGFYILVDVHGIRYLTIVMEWMGKHALIIFVLVACNVLPSLIQGFYWKKQQNNLLTFMGIGKMKEKQI